MSGYKRVNYYELCRLCTTTEGTKMHIFREEGRRRQLSNKIPLCLPLQVSEEDSLPKIICSTCVEKLESFYEFREACVNAEAMLESYFSTIRAEDHKEGQLAAVYVRETYPTKDTTPAKFEVSTATPQVPGPTLVLPVGTDGLSNLIQAAGLQIVADTDSSRLQPILGSTSTPVLEASDGTRYAYVSSAVPAPEISLEKNIGLKIEKTAENSDKLAQQPQHSSQLQPQTITFAGQEMMVHFNLKDTDATNPQLQRASIAQLGEFLKMNLVDGAALVKDPTIPGGVRIVGIPQTVLPAQHMQPQQQQQEHHHQQQHQHHQQQQQQQQQQQLEQQHQQHHLHSQQIQQLLQTQTIQHQEIEQQLKHQHQLNQQHHQQQNLPQTQSPLKKRNKRDSIKPTIPQQQTQQQPQQQQQQQQQQEQQQQLQIQQSHEKVQSDFKAEFTNQILQFGSENEAEDDMHDDMRDDSSSQGEIERHDSLFSSIEAVVSGAGGEDLDPKSLEKFIYACDDCPKLFKRKEHLYQHQKLHTGERPYVCQHCDKTFVRKEHLLRHSISHSGSKQFECEQCGKNFSRKDNLHKHRKTHSSEGPFICNACGKSFVVKHYFLMHLACHGVTVESENGEVILDPVAFPFKCDLCGKGYPTKAFCDSHRLRHRKLKKKNREKYDKNDSSDATAEEKDQLNEDQHLEESKEPNIDNIQQLQIQNQTGSQNEAHHSDIQPCQVMRELLDNRVVPVTLQASVPTSNGVSTHIIPHIIPQKPGTPSVLIQANGATFICSPDMLENYRLQP